LPFWVAKTKYSYCLGGLLREKGEGKRGKHDWRVHSAQRREKREKGKENSEIKAGKRQRNNKGG